MRRCSASRTLLGDIGLRTGETDGVSVFTLGDATAVHPAEGPVNVTQTVLDLEMRALAGQMRLNRLLQRGTILFVGQRHPVLERRDAVVWRHADHQLPARRAVEGVGGDVPVPDAVVRTVYCQFVPLF